jgi:phosphohistidine phosphatase SixA
MVMIGRMVRGAAIAMLLIAGTVQAQTTTPPAATQPTATPAAAPAAPARPEPVATLENRRMTPSAMMPLLREGGLIMLMRHERTEVPSRIDDYSKPINDCMAQRNLSVAGVANATETGAQLRVLDIPVGAVMASAMCRTMDTGRLIFGRVVAEPRLLHHDNVAERTVTVSGRELNTLLADVPLNDGNVAMVSHIGNIYFATGMRLSEGEIGVLQRQADGTLVILGQIIPNELGAIARQRLMEREEAAPPR